MTANYDYIIVGAGSAGCVIANRLTESKDVSVLVLEAGGWDRHPLLRMPIAWTIAARTERFGWGYMSEPEPNLDGRQIPLPRGKVLGGSSSINGMLYVRGHASDYDQWRQMGLSGWGFADVLPYFKRSENNWRGETKYHGGSGPLRIAPARGRHLLYEPVRDAAKAAGFPISDDLNGENHEGLSVPEITVSRFGRRVSAARAFLYPALQRPNLTLSTGVLTTRILIEKGRAVGVEYMEQGQLHRAYAAREVVVSAGAYNSPQLLMLSGIGPADALRLHGIKPLLDLPGVGQNLMEHPLAPFSKASRDPVTLLRHVRMDRAAYWTARWLMGASSLFGMSGISANLFARTRPELERPDIQFIFANARTVGTELWWPWNRKGQPYTMNASVSLLHPESRGHVALRSANPADRMRVYLNQFSEKRDLDTLVHGIKIGRDLYAQSPLREMVAAELLPGPDIRSDGQIADYIRRMSATTQHPCGTCRMGSDSNAVVDATLKLRGLDGLRVADASVMPTIPGGNINAPVIMIGEKAADLIRGRQLPPATL
jgi:choline dehydrogenase